MSGHSIYCPSCGALVAGGGNYCENCGQPLKKNAPAREKMAEPARASAAPRPAARAPTRSEPLDPFDTFSDPPVVKPKKRNGWGLALGGLGCLVILCAGMITAAAMLISARVKTAAPIEPSAAPTAVSERVPPTLTSVPRRIPTAEPQPTLPPTQALTRTQPPAAWSPDIGQERTNTRVSDDFTNGHLGWANVKDDQRFLGILNGHYAMHLYQPNSSTWVDLPGEFTPTTIAFEAAVLPGHDQGAYGVICHYQDERSYHFVSIDPLNRQYAIGRRVNGEDQALMGERWMPAQYLNEMPYAVNIIQVSCGPDTISLSINNQLEGQAAAGAVTPGPAALRVETFAGLPAGSFQVLIDNFSAFVPVQ